MFQVKVTTVKKGNIEVNTELFELAEPDTAEFNAAMKALGNCLYDLDLVFDEDQGDGDMAIDDILMMAAEEEPFEETLAAKHCRYIITGEEI